MNRMRSFTLFRMTIVTSVISTEGRDLKTRRSPSGCASQNIVNETYPYLDTRGNLSFPFYIFQILNFQNDSKPQNGISNKRSKEPQRPQFTNTFAAQVAISKSGLVLAL